MKAAIASAFSTVSNIMSGKESKSKSKEAAAGKTNIIGLGTWEKHVALSDDYRAAQSRERKKKGLDKLALGKDVDPNMPKVGWSSLDPGSLCLPARA
jgi:hypothetical protein